jgi:hypothetical protein
MEVKWLTVVAVSVLVAFAFVGGYFTRTALAQPALAEQGPDVAPTVDKLPPDVHPQTFARIGWATRDEFKTPEDLAAFDKAVAAAPTYGKPKDGTMIEGNGIRLHIPIVHIAYRDTIQNLNQKNYPDSHYNQLATLIGCRENNEEVDWLNHEMQSAGKTLPREVIEVVRSNKSTEGLPEKDQVLIEFGREIFHQPKVTSKTYADMNRLFGERGTLAFALLMAHYTDDAILYRVYDQHLLPGTKRPFPDVLAREAKGQ